MRYKYVLFDFDGTLADSAEGIMNSIMYALSKYGIKPESKNELYRFIGPPLYDSFREFYGFSHERALEATDYFREYYAKRGMYECRLYGGIKELLSKINNSGRYALVATSKPEATVKGIIQYLGITDCFDFIAGASFDLTRSTKCDVLKYVIDEFGIDTSSAIMIGDRNFDVLGAKKFCIVSLGVTFGYGNRRELELAGADYIADSPEEIEKIIIT